MKTGSASGDPNLTMVISSSPQAPAASALLQYLRHQIGLGDSALDLGLKQAEIEQAPLPVVLWRYGLINLEQLAQVLDWQDQRL